MKKTLFHILLASTIVAVCSSCSDIDTKYGLLGTEKYYEPWLGKDFIAQRMEHTLELEWNDDSKATLGNTPVRLELYTKDNDGLDIPARDVILYVNDVMCDENSFEVTTNDVELNFAIEFKKEATEGQHVYYLKYKQPYGVGAVLDEIAFENFGSNNELMAEKVIIMNPLKEKVLWGSGVVLALLIVWLIASRLIFWPAMGFSRIEIDYHDGGGFRRIRTAGCYELVLTNDKRKSDNIFEKIFKGSRKYEVNEFWTSPVVIKSGMRRTIQINSHKRIFTSEPLRPIRREEFTLSGRDGQSATLRTN